MTDCAAPRHDGQDERAPAEPSAYLCGPCHYGLSKDLRRLPHHHAELDVLPSRVAGAGNGDGLPFNDTASECRSQIRRDLTFWCRHVTETRGMDAAPPWAHDGWAANPVPAMAGWLAGQVKWIIFRDWAPLMAGAIHDDATRARTLLDPYVTARIVPQGQDGLCLACESKDPCTCDDCGEVFSGIPAFTAHFARDNRDRLWCELPSVMGLARSPSGRWSNRVVVTVYKSDGDRRRSFIWCRGCDGRWEPEQWLSYGQRVVKRREAIASLPVRTMGHTGHCGALDHRSRRGPVVRRQQAHHPQMGRSGQLAQETRTPRAVLLGRRPGQLRETTRKPDTAAPSVPLDTVITCA